MARPVVLSNGRLFVGLNENGLVHDFYFPYVGLENLTSARSLEHKIGVWVDGQFSWVDDHSWQITVDFEPTALVSHIEMQNDQLGLKLQSNDFVDQELSAFVRHMTLTNTSDATREVRLFMHQVFQISPGGRGDTVLLAPEPDNDYILNYKGRTCLAIGGKTQTGKNFDQFAVGNYAIEGKAGTYRDAEDGLLSGNLIEHGGVDSTIGFTQQLEPGAHTSIDYWVVAGSNQGSVQSGHLKLRTSSIADRLSDTRGYFAKWLAPADKRVAHLDNAQKVTIFKSLLVIKAHCDVRGSILASGDSDIFNYGRDYYCYCWPRDGAYAVWPLIRLGIYDEARRFFRFCAEAVNKGGYLAHKYQPDMAIGSSWHPRLHDGVAELPIQADETAIVLFMLHEYYQSSGDKALIEELYDSFIRPASTFLSQFVDEQTGLPHASYDLWEEKFLTSTYTTATTIGGLEAGAKLANLLAHPDHATSWQTSAGALRDQLGRLTSVDGVFLKGYRLHADDKLEFDETIDISSLYGPLMFARLGSGDGRLSLTARAIEHQLLDRSPAGGVIRYENDNYFRADAQYPGNPWVVCTLWLAQYYSFLGKRDSAQSLLDWVLGKQLPSGMLSEQFEASSAQPISVTPLVWSHAELINTILDISLVPAPTDST